MPLGHFIGALFFILLSIAALTSMVSLLEVVIAYFVDETDWARERIAWVMGGVIFLLGVPSGLAQGAVPALSDMSWLVGDRFFGPAPSFLDILDFVWGNISLALGALLISVFVGWIWGTGQAIEELQEGSDDLFAGPAATTWSVFLKYVCPVVIAAILGGIVAGVI
jgi:NSS family neurotransmitter:Na+ symporter